MDDSAAKAVRTKKDSSIRVACRMLRDGDVQGVVSAGNTGAVMATAKTVLGHGSAEWTVLRSHLLSHP